MSDTPTPFSLAALKQFIERPVSGLEQRDYIRLFVGWDDVHGALKFLLTLPGITSLTMNMFGYDDDALNDIVMKLVTDPTVLTMITLDKSQAGGVHEKKLIDADKMLDLAAFNAHVAIGQSGTHSISHTKGGVIRYAGGAVGWEGSTNWSSDGEGTFVLGRNTAGGPGYKAQNNTLQVDTNGEEVQAFEDRLRAEHLIAAKAAPSL